MPTPLLKALQTAAPHLKLTVGQIIRSAIEDKLSSIVTPLVEIARDSRSTPRQRLQAVAMLRLCATGSMWLGPYGKALARARAQAEEELGEIPSDPDRQPGTRRSAGLTRKSKGTGRKRLTSLDALLQRSQHGEMHLP